MRDLDKEYAKSGQHKYVFDFDKNVMHKYMLETFKLFSRPSDRALELGCFRGDFSERLVEFYQSLVCVEGAAQPYSEARERLAGKAEVIHSLFEYLDLKHDFDAVIMTHVLEHLDNPVEILSRINREWLSDTGRLFLMCPNANAPSRQLAVKMGILGSNAEITEAEWKHGHRKTYSLDTLEEVVRRAGLKPVFRTGVFYKPFANFQWDQLLGGAIVSDEFVEGCFKLGQIYPDHCASILLVCEKGLE